MNALNKIANDWEGHQATRTNAIDGKPWGWQWGGAGLFKRMREILRPEYIRGPVLDIGCGGGKWEKWFIDTFGVEVIGGDVHRTAVDDARAYEPRATYVILEVTACVSSRMTVLALCLSLMCSRTCHKS